MSNQLTFHISGDLPDPEKIARLVADRMGWSAPKPHARRSDPSTSRAAGQAVDLNARCREVLAAIYRMRLSKPTFTDTDIAETMGEERGICARRRKDLVERGLVEPVWLNGEQETRMGSRGRPVEVWMLSEAGYLLAAVTS